jgi:hypothetical protein
MEEASGARRKAAKRVLRARQAGVALMVESSGARRKAAKGLLRVRQAGVVRMGGANGARKWAVERLPDRKACAWFMVWAIVLVAILRRTTLPNRLGSKQLLAGGVTMLY